MRPKVSQAVEPASDSERFTQLSEECLLELNESTKAITLARDRLQNSLLENNEIEAYVQRVEWSNQRVQKDILMLAHLGNQAFTNVNKGIEDIKDKIESSILANDDGFQYTQQLIETLTSQVKAQEETIDRLNETIDRLYILLKPPQITRDHAENAKYLIDNVKNNQGKPIKGASITIQNIQSVLEAYDRLKGYSDTVQTVEATHIRRPVKTSRTAK